MPDTIRITGGSLKAHPRRGGFRIVALFIVLCAIASPARAQSPELRPTDTPEPSFIGAYLNAFAQLNGHEIAAMALTLSVLCFAVVTAILLLRTRARLAETETTARDEIIASKAEVDRVYALLRSEPQILVSWAAAGDAPEIIGDIGLVADAEAPHRVLAFGLWLDPDNAQAMEGAVTGLRERGDKFAIDSNHVGRAPDRGRGPGGGRARDPAPEGRRRRQARACGAARPFRAPA